MRAEADVQRHKHGDCLQTLSHSYTSGCKILHDIPFNNSMYCVSIKERKKNTASQMGTKPCPGLTFVVPLILIVWCIVVTILDPDCHTLDF